MPSSYSPLTLLGFDFGLSRTGLAVANTLTGLATPECVLYSVQGQPDWAGIGKRIQTWRPDLLIVGLPQKTDGSQSTMHDAIIAFAKALEQRSGLPVQLFAETLSSREAEERLKQARQAGRKRKVRKEDIDQLAAAIILENWMQENAHAG